MDNNDIIQSPNSTIHIWADSYLTIMIYIRTYVGLFIRILYVTVKLILVQSLCHLQCNIEICSQLEFLIKVK